MKRRAILWAIGWNLTQPSDSGPGRMNSGRGNSYAPRTEQKVESWAPGIPSSSNPEKKVSEFSPKKVWQKVCPYRRGLDVREDVEGGLGGASLVLVVLDVRREVTGEESAKIAHSIRYQV
ncbi:hypothetical protein RJ640_017693 [Escallonia rubra]|uniref:Uncharacterized protein n=1 Tax=Escallonia rubra TaxID=112253 RepID=A0AA88QFE4_9ASTE|nr:hypothetical protein RJ640_017693 [Escallonia rubra]